MLQEADLLDRITVRPDVYGGKPIICDMRIAVEHVLGKLAAGDTAETILSEYPFLEPEDIQTCLVFAHRSMSGEHVPVDPAPPRCRQTQAPEKTGSTTPSRRRGCSTTIRLDTAATSRRRCWPPNRPS